MSREKKMNSLYKEDCHCHYCGRPTWCARLGMSGEEMEQATLDHIILYSQVKADRELRKQVGGCYTRNNMVIACKRCNWSRQTLKYEVFKGMVRPDAEMTKDDWRGIENYKKAKKKQRGRWFEYWGRMKKYGIEHPA